MIRYNAAVVAASPHGGGSSHRLEGYDERRGAGDRSAARDLHDSLPGSSSAGRAISRPKSAPRWRPSAMFPPRRWRFRRSVVFGSWTATSTAEFPGPAAPARKFGIRPRASIRRKGVYVGAYIWSDDIGDAFAAKPLPERLADTLADTERLHPGASEHLRKGVSVAWKKVPYTGGAWAEWTRAARASAYPVLLRGDGPFLFCGEHLSHINGWQEGAVRSAHRALAQVAERTQPAK